MILRRTGLVKFFDRDAELGRLESLLRCKDGGLAVLWGRRRVGKSRLLLEWCRRSNGLYTVADASAEAVQRRYFAESLAPRFPSLAEAQYPDWRALLRALAREAARAAWRGPLIFDELPYLVASAPQLASQLQAFVDGEARDAGLVIAVAGSAQRMMHGLALVPGRRAAPQPAGPGGRGPEAAPLAPAPRFAPLRSLGGALPQERSEALGAAPGPRSGRAVGTRRPLLGRRRPGVGRGAPSLSGAHLLLGEVKWQARSATAAQLQGALADLDRKGVPRALASGETQVIRAVFLPRVEPRARSMAAGAAVVEAADVIGALGS
jgi:hypothetical protein